MITTKNNGTQTAVYTPYNAAFVSAIRKIGGARWDAGSKAWMVPTASLPQVRAIMRDVFGEDDQLDTCKRVTVRLTFREICSAECRPVEILGKTVSKAYGRDSGARPGDDVAFEAGGPRSGGSAKNWRSVVEEGSVAILRNVPETMLDKAELPEGVTMEIIQDSGIDRAALLEEKEKLLARLAEIEKMLNA
jgi:hypothetical protein